MSLWSLAGVALVAGAVAVASCGGNGGNTTVIKKQAPAETTTVTTPSKPSAPSSPPSSEPQEEASGGDVPDVVHERLDVATRKVKEAGYAKRWVGGGVFGIVVPSNWVVCEQDPAAGTSAPPGTVVDLIVDRTC